MNPIAFIDTEIEPKSRKILDLGGIKNDGSIFHQTSLKEFSRFLEGTNYICGHNIINHDINYIGTAVLEAKVNPSNIIDTLFLSPLLFPAKPYHALLKDDKLQSEQVNNPLNDSIKAKDLFYDEIAAFKQTDETLQQIFYLLLNERKEFRGFFRFINYTSPEFNTENLIRLKFENDICEHVDLTKIISERPVELAYSLALINTQSRYSMTPPWVLKNFPEVERIMFLLRDTPCITGCRYCNQALDIHQGLKRFFGFNSFRTFGGEPLQEKAVKAAVENKSILAVFPTGGGKSLTFQIPALMSGENAKGLTVIISPLQSLMKDQVDNLEKNGITDAVTINGLLDPIERAKSFERVEDGKTVQEVPPTLAALYRPSVQPYMISWIKYDPAKEIAKLKIPVMIIQGTTDIQVAANNARLLASAKPEALLLILENMNHILKESVADIQKNMATYKDSSLPLKEGLTEGIIRFIKTGK